MADHAKGWGVKAGHASLPIERDNVAW